MGMIPHLTPDIIDDIPVYFSAGDFVENALPKNVPIPVGVGMGQRWVFMGPGTDFFNFDEGPTAKGIKIYARNGSLKFVTPEDYSLLVESVRPQGIISLYSSILPNTSNRQKKIRTEMATQFSTKYENTINFTSHISQNDENALFVQCGELTEEIEDEITSAISRRPENLPRMILMDGYPSDLRKAISLGFDLLIPRLPFVFAERGFAMTFSFDGKSESKSICIDLKSPEYEHDHSPISEDCDCQCCQHHTKSYLYHLLEVHEMLIGTLLVQHNIRHYQRFVQAIAEEEV
ncbi:queuine tRNA-ribosyltransferase accessory subunit 2 [Histomonas meleagridis]|uniref:queuine tRNA-ribosyltransferase accessory subunit 2 n=1 Tax=Histomonas meleagridis TaxID=135588 RepID=UPI0035597031|nr:queuine tRNA-ribosyltransferase accessory subunit 2 [Histomonas meleagridis]KAH0796510.1 queuine tRNA-ribosyltransferase accessory subunit 2 [Histomonas meleagridis]